MTSYVGVYCYLHRNGNLLRNAVLQNPYSLSNVLSSDISAALASATSATPYLPSSRLCCIALPRSHCPARRNCASPSVSPLSPLCHCARRRRALADVLSLDVMPTAVPPLPLLSILHARAAMSTAAVPPCPSSSRRRRVLAPRRACHCCCGATLALPHDWLPSSPQLSRPWPP